jgi:hypothetical protein
VVKNQVFGSRSCSSTSSCSKRTGQRTQRCDERSASLAGYTSNRDDLEACVATSYKLQLKLQLPTVSVGKRTRPLQCCYRHYRDFHLSQRGTRSATSGIRSGHDTLLRGRKQGVLSIEGGHARSLAMLMASATFVEALSVFLSFFYGELVNDEIKFMGTEVDEISLSLTPSPSRYGRVYSARFPIAPIVKYHLYRHRVLWSVFNKLKKEVVKAIWLATDAKRGVDRSTTGCRRVGRRDRASADE